MTISFNQLMTTERETLISEITEAELKWIALEDALLLIKKAMKHDLDNKTTEELLEQHDMIFNR